MSDIKLEGLREEVVKRVKPFISEAMKVYKDNIHSIHIIGSSLTGDFDASASDTNSIFVLNKMDMGFLRAIAPLGKKHSKMKVAAPIIMTPQYVENSKDVFPMEFLNIKLVHRTIMGEDIFENLEIKRSDLRLQCERVLKEKLIGLRQGYISSLGDKKSLQEGLISSVTGYIPLFRGIVFLLGKKPPVLNADVLRELRDITGLDISVFEKVLLDKRRRANRSLEEINQIFEEFYFSTERLVKVVDELKA